MPIHYGGSPLTVSKTTGQKKIHTVSVVHAANEKESKQTLAERSVVDGPYFRPKLKHHYTHSCSSS
jgi:hypothetical protein